MKKISVALLALLTLPAFGKTEFSQLVDYVQKTYASKYQDHPILVFDLDEVEYRFAKAGVFGKGNKTLFKFHFFTS